MNEYNNNLQEISFEDMKNMGSNFVKKTKKFIERNTNKGLNELQRVTLILLHIIYNKFDDNTKEKIKNKLKINEESFKKLLEKSNEIVTNNKDVEEYIKRLPDNNTINDSKPINEASYNYTIPPFTPVNNYQELYKYAVETRKKLPVFKNSELNRIIYNKIDEILQNGSDFFRGKYESAPDIRKFDMILHNAEYMERRINSGVDVDIHKIGVTLDNYATENPIDFSRKYHDIRFNPSFNDKYSLVSEDGKSMVTGEKIYDNHEDLKNNMRADAHPEDNNKNSNNDNTDSILNMKNIISLLGLILPFIMSTKWGKNFLYNVLLKHVKSENTKYIIFTILANSGFIINFVLSPSILGKIFSGIFLFVRFKSAYKNIKYMNKVKDQNRDILSFQTIPFFNYNINSNKITFISRSAQDFNNSNIFRNFIQNTKSNNKSLIDILNNCNSNIVLYLLQFNDNIKILGFFDKNTKNIINFIIVNEIINNFKQSNNNNFNMSDFVKTLILTLKSNFEFAYNNLLLTDLNNDCANIFIKTINNPNNEEFNNYCKSLGGTPIDREYFVYYGILNEKNINKDDSSNYPLNISPLSHTIINDQFVLDNNNVIVLENATNDQNNEKIQQNNEKIQTYEKEIKKLEVQHKNNEVQKIKETIEKIKNESNEIRNQSFNNIQLSAKPKTINGNDDIVDNTIENAAIGAISGTAIGSTIFDNSIFKQWAEEFCNLHPTVGPILKPILQNPKTSSTIIGTLIGMGMRPLANKLINFFKLKKKEGA